MTCTIAEVKIGIKLENDEAKNNLIVIETKTIMEIKIAGDVIV